MFTHSAVPFVLRTPGFFAATTHSTARPARSDRRQQTVSGSIAADREKGLSLSILDTKSRSLLFDPLDHLIHELIDVGLYGVSCLYPVADAALQQVFYL